MIKDVKIRTCLSQKMLDDFDNAISLHIENKIKEKILFAGRINRSTLIRGFMTKFIAENQDNDN